MSTILGYIDAFARIVMNDRAAAREKQADSDYLAEMSKRDPQGYAKEMWWRDNMRRKKAGVPTDPGIEEQGRRRAESLRDNGFL